MEHPNEYWRGTDNLHRAIALVLAIGLGLTYLLGRPTATSPGWCAAPSVAATVPGIPPAPAEAAPDPIPATARVYFAVNSTKPPQQVDAALSGVIAYLRTHSGAKAQVSGYHDPSGNSQRNQQLAQQRADGVRAVLVAAGIDPARLVIDAAAQTEGSGDAAEARRAEVRIDP